MPEIKKEQRKKGKNVSTPRENKKRGELPEEEYTQL
jgi:hypothetical protein